MSKATASILNSCARDLTEIRAQLPCNLEPGIQVQLDSVIERLRLGHELTDHSEVGGLVKDSLEVIGRVGKAVLVISEVIDRFSS